MDKVVVVFGKLFVAAFLTFWCLALPVMAIMRLCGVI